MLVNKINENYFQIDSQLKFLKFTYHLNFNLKNI